jgi:D-glycero-D-manno-heptose 1,7-bisphosphate phosphatase
MKQKAIFLDRDGVIIRNDTHYYIWKLEQMSFVDGINDNLRLLTNLGFQLFIVSNQGGISKGIYHSKDIQQLHQELITRFNQEGIQINDILFCRHHPDIEKCLCRKPDSLMIEKLIAKYNICREDSYFIGDTESDMRAARNAGINGIKIQANENMIPYISLLVS